MNVGTPSIWSSYVPLSSRYTSQNGKGKFNTPIIILPIIE